MDTAVTTRYQVRQQALSANGLEEIDAAKHAIRAWQSAHPDEPKMYDAMEMLYNLEEAALLTLAAQAQEREKAA